MSHEITGYSGGMHRWISISTKETKSSPDREQSYSSAQVDKKLVNKAANAINQLSREGKINLVRIERVKDEVAGSYFWHFSDHYDHHSVKIDGITNQVLEVDTIYTDWKSDKDFAKSFAKPKYTPKQAIKLNPYSMSIWPDIKLLLN